MAPNKYEKANLVALPDGMIETDCLVCGETLLLESGDKMHIYVGENQDGTTEVFGIFCANCEGDA